MNPTNAPTASLLVMHPRDKNCTIENGISLLLKERFYQKHKGGCRGLKRYWKKTELLLLHTELSSPVAGKCKKKCRQAFHPHCELEYSIANRLWKLPIFASITGASGGLICVKNFQPWGVHEKQQERTKALHCAERLPVLENRFLPIPERLGSGWAAVRLASDKGEDACSSEIRRPHLEQRVHRDRRQGFPFGGATYLSQWWQESVSRYRSSRRNWTRQRFYVRSYSRLSIRWTPSVVDPLSVLNEVSLSPV